MRRKELEHEKPLVVNDMMRRKLQAQTKYSLRQEQSRQQNYFKDQLRKEYQLNKIRRRELEQIEQAR